MRAWYVADVSKINSLERDEIISPKRPNTTLLLLPLIFDLRKSINYLRGKQQQQRLSEIFQEQKSRTRAFNNK